MGIFILGDQAMSLDNEERKEPVQRNVIVVEGYDGTGKTTLALSLADRLGYRYSKPYAKTGELIKFLHENKYYEEAHAVAFRSVEMELAKDSRNIVFDRHWLTPIVYAGEQGAHLWGLRKPLTIICTCDESGIRRRLIQRGEQICDNNIKSAEKFLQYAKKFGLHTVDTTNLDMSASLERALHFILES
jgi:thymidylate kinase